MQTGLFSIFFLHGEIIKKIMDVIKKNKYKKEYMLFLWIKSEFGPPLKQRCIGPQSQPGNLRWRGTW